MRFSPAAWEARVAESRALVDSALTQAEALDLLRRRPELLQELVASRDSWINRGGEVISAANPATGVVHPQSYRPKRAALPYDHLFEDIASRRDGGAQRSRG